MSSRRTRTPEEIAKSMEIARSVMANQKKKDGLDSVKHGRNYIFVASAFYIINGAFMYYYKMMIDFYIYAGLTGFYFLLAFIYSKNPFVVSIIAFVIFILIIVLQAIADPRSLFGGLLFFALKIAVISGLIASMRNAIKYKRYLESDKGKQRENDVLDEGLIGNN